MTRARAARRSGPRPRARPPRRGNGYLLTGLLLGVGLGLLVAWVLAPVRYVDTTPDRLRADFKDAYRALIALAYQGNPDLVRAQARLALLGDPNPAQALAVQAQHAQTRGARTYEIEALQRLAADLSRAAGAGVALSPARPANAEPSPTPTPTTATLPAAAPPTVAAVRTPTPTPSPRPTVVVEATATPALFFRVFKKEMVCDPAQPGLVRVEVYDAEVQPLPGVAIVVLGPQGEQVIYTGLQPERGLGYADFIMDAGATYRVRVQSGSETADGLGAVTCRGDQGETYAGGWQVIFTARPTP